MIIFVNETFAVDPEDVSALERYEKWDSDPSPSGSSWIDHEGTIVIQKNGRKTYVKDLTPRECHVLIFGRDVSEVKEIKMVKYLKYIPDWLLIFLISVLIMLAICWFSSGCVTQPTTPLTVPLAQRIIPQDPSTRERVLMRSCRAYKDVSATEVLRWYRKGESLITQDSGEHEGFYRVFEINDYATGFINKLCF